jgi:ATP-dependent RNA helicase DeaD
MLREEIKETLGPALTEALEKRGFSELTPVQEAILLEDAVGHDLRVSSQTGSGKTVAIGLALRSFLGEPTPGAAGIARPRALVVVPTRELAKQVQEELSWLFAPLGARVMSVTGGGGYRDEMRSFAGGPAIIVGTPGRLLDHLTRGGINTSEVRAAVMDEADRMLDLGFREDLVAILGSLPEGHRTHLVSATFPREVRALADSVQRDVVNVEGTPIGRANADIEHIIHLVHVHERFDAIVNLLLENPGAQTLIFARTRADVAALTRRLAEAGFSMDSLSGEMEQRERNRALASFKRGDLDALVATDVAARGIDVSDIAQVIHADPPDDPDSYTHRSGRTGRAGKKGRSSLILTPSGLARATMLLRRAGVTFSRGPIPNADKIRAREDEKLATELTVGPESEGSPLEPDERALALSRTLLGSDQSEMAVARLVMRIRGKRPEPRDVTPIDMHRPDPRGGFDRDDRGPRGRDDRDDRGRDDRGPGPRDLAPRRARNPDARWVPFRVSWGKVHGAEVRRVLAMVCRRGEIQSGDVGSIHIAPMYSIVDVSEAAAPAFAEKTGIPDPRDPRVVIERQTASQMAARDGGRDGGPRDDGPRDGGRDSGPPPREGRDGRDDRGGDRGPRSGPPFGKPRGEYVARPKPRGEYMPRPRDNGDAPRIVDHTEVAPKAERVSRPKISDEGASPKAERVSRPKISDEGASPKAERVSRPKISDEGASPKAERVSRPKISDEGASPKAERVSRPKVSDDAPRPHAPKRSDDGPRPHAPKRSDDGPRPHAPKGDYQPRPRSSDDRPHAHKKPGGPYKPKSGGGGFGKKPGGPAAGGGGGGGGGFGKPKSGGYPRPKEYTPGPKKPYVKK